LADPSVARSDFIIVKAGVQGTVSPATSPEMDPELTGRNTLLTTLSRKVSVDRLDTLSAHVPMPSRKWSSRI
jgi:hypothetical protein